MISKLQLLSKTKPNLIFDFDKTIAQMEIDWANWHSGISEIFSKFDENHGYLLGKDPHIHYNSLVEQHGDSLVEAVKIFVSDYEMANNHGFTPNPEIIEFIKSSQGSKLFVFSSNSRKTVEAGLKHLAIFDLFEGIISRDDVLKIKPDPEGFYLLPDFVNNKNKYLMIGDSLSDQLAASSANIEFLKCTFFETYNFESN